jgi:3-hydroxybutyryl-CoA dehydrogenase
MTLDAKRSDLVVGVVGTGTMGRGIAQAIAEAGIHVRMLDATPGAATAAKDYIGEMLEKQAARGRSSATHPAETLARIAVVEDIGELATSHIVIEAIVEDLAAKRQLFAALEAVVAPTCVFATNTSSLQVTAMAAGLAHPERVGGFHCFNPVPLNRIVEVVDGVRTAPWATDALATLARRMGHYPARAKDVPGFISNLAARPYYTEALRIADEGIAHFHDVDRILREAVGFKIGPFELTDLVGVDILDTVNLSMYRLYHEDPRIRPSLTTGRMAAAGLLGRKTRRGFYTYSASPNTADPIPDAALPPARPKAVWISRAEPEGEAVLEAWVARLGGNVDHGARPGPESLCLVAPLGIDGTSAALAESLDPTRTVAVDTLFPLEKRRTMMLTPATSDFTRAEAHGLLGADGRPVSVLRDGAGFVAQRMVAVLVNMACDMMQRGIASAEALDHCLAVSRGFPKGPLALGDTIGPARILRILEALDHSYRDGAYRPSPWLVRRAQLGVSLTREDPVI